MEGNDHFTALHAWQRRERSGEVDCGRVAGGGGRERVVWVVDKASGSGGAQRLCGR